MESQQRWRNGVRKLAALTTVGLALAAGLTGCASNNSDGSGSTQSVSSSQIDAALQKKTTITIWTWATTLDGVVKAFEAKHPNITVNVVNVGTGAAHYTKLENAIKAGKGAPDLATIEYSVLPQFGLEKSLVDLNQFGYGDLKDKYTPSVWSSTNVNGALYELPHNAGPMALFYNKTVFDKFGISVPKTWDEYAAAAKKIHDADPTVSMASDAGDPGFVTSMLWQAGAKPFSTSGTSDVSIDLNNTATKKFTNFYQPLITDKVLAQASGFSNEWYQGLANGKIATLTTGAWMAGSLKSGVPSGSGQWRVAPMPTYGSGQAASAMNGGGGYAMLKQSSKQHQMVSAAFLKFMDAGPGVKLSIAAGQFPTTIADLKSEEFLNTPNSYFGGQQINKVFAQSAADAVPGWQYLPYQSYANTVFSDTAGQAYLGKTTLAKGLDEWGAKLDSYGKDQGFNVK
jgi:multiple sugar transport system substrate-binding protein